MIRTRIPAFVGNASGSSRSAALTYYVATTGSDANDGTTAATPVLTFQKALDLCAATATYSRGPFTIEIAAGTYTVTAKLSYSPALFAGGLVTFKGPAVAAGSPPTAIIQGSATGARTATFIQADGPSILSILQDIKFQSFGGMCAAVQGGRIWLTRVWAKNCLSVVAASVGGVVAVSGGDWDGRDLSDVKVPNGQGFVSVMVSPFSLQQANYADGLLVHHWVWGAAISECGSGHMDFVRFEDCDTGVALFRSTGAPNMTSTRWWRCGIGILAAGNGPLLIAQGQDFGQGTADACTINVVNTIAPTHQELDDAFYNTRQDYFVAGGTSGSNLTGSIAERTIVGAVTLIRGRVRANDNLDYHLECRGVLSTVGTMRLYFGATEVAEWTVPIGTADARIEIQLHAKNATDWRGQVTQVACPLAATGTSTITLIADALAITSLTADTAVTITWQAGAVGDFWQARALRVRSSIAGIT